VPTDWGTIFKSVSKTGRLLVVQEDNRTSSFGQSIIAECVAKKEIWPLLKSAPKLIAREDVHIGFHSNLENYVLPHKEDVVREILSIVSST
jgi:2-oxoisovalerate dehydrogenase E1 component